jgi:hypothetical protein
MNAPATQIRDVQDVRDGPRRNMFLAATLRRGTEQAPVKIRNMSALGALIDSPIVPEPNSTVELIRGQYIAEGRVVWSEPRRCGIRFLSQLSVNDWLAPIEAQPALKVLNEAPALVDAAPAACPENPASELMITVPSDDLVQVAKLVEQSARALARDPSFLRDHMMEGRNLICAMQMLTRMCELLKN